MTTHHRSRAYLTVTLVLLSSLGVAGFLLIADFVSSEALTAFDRRGADACRAIATPTLTIFMKLITQSASSLAVAIAGAVLGAGTWWRTKQLSRTIFTPAVLAVSSGTGLLLKLIFARSRPDWYPWLLSARGFSFPSGHTLSACLLAGLIAWTAWRRYHRFTNALITLLLTLWAVGVGISRVYIGVHYPSDVLSSVALAIACLAAATLVGRRILPPHGGV